MDSTPEIIVVRPVVPALEGLALVSMLAAYTLATFVLTVPASVLMLSAACWLCGLLYLSWRKFQHGMHPAFLFLALLLLFQGGGLLGYLISRGDADPMRIMLASVPFDVAYEAKRTTLLILMASGLCIYLVPRLSRSRLEYQPPSSARLLPFILLIFLVALPFHFWKNYEYFEYVRTHGGYLAIFRSEEHLAEVGFLVRAMSQVCSSAFLVYFAYERPRPRLAFLTFLYIVVSTLELMIGLRGKVLLFFICLLFLYKLKRGTTFRLRTLVVLVVCLAITAEAVEVFRENKHEKVSAWEIPAIFLNAEGVSLNQTEAIIAFYQQFAPYRWSYLRFAASGLYQAQPESQARRPQGEVLADDSGMFLNPRGFELGFGTGGSYLAEGYLYGKAFGVIGESLLIACLLVWITKNFRGWRIPFAWSAMVGIIYLPREDLMVAVPGILKSWIGLCLVFAAAWTMASALGWARKAASAISTREAQNGLRST